jgi:hypothetical protein
MEASIMMETLLQYPRSDITREEMRAAFNAVLGEADGHKRLQDEFGADVYNTLTQCRFVFASDFMSVVDHPEVGLDCDTPTMLSKIRACRTVAELELRTAEVHDNLVAYDRDLYQIYLTIHVVEGKLLRASISSA